MNRDMNQKAARTAQERTGCKYQVALEIARRPDVHAEARKDDRVMPFRTKLAEAVIRRLK